MSKTIELKKVFKPKTLHEKLLFLLIKATALVTVVIIGSAYVVEGTGIAQRYATQKYGEFIRAITRVEIVKEYVRPESIPVSQIVPTIAHDMRVPTVALQAIIEQESSGAKKLYRFEEKKYSELRRVAQYAKYSDDEIRMLASSHGAAHVMGFNALPRCGIHWSKLYDSTLGVECGAKILRENLDRYASVEDASQKLWYALRDYNGSGSDAEAYADKVMGRIGALLFNKLGEEL